MTSTVFSTDSCNILLRELSIYLNLRDSQYRNFIKASSPIYSSDYSGWVPMVDMFAAENWPVAISTERLYSFPFQHIILESTYYKSSYTEFNRFFLNKRPNLRNITYTLNGEEAILYVGAGLILNKDFLGRLKTLFMVCLSNKFCMDIFNEERDFVTNRADVKVFIDPDFMLPKYQKIYKIIDSLYLQPMIKAGIEICIKPSEFFMKDVLGSPLQDIVYSQEELEEFNRLIREEVI